MACHFIWRIITYDFLFQITPLETFNLVSAELPWNSPTYTSLQVLIQRKQITTNTQYNPSRNLDTFVDSNFTLDLRFSAV
jgi:hypothetical protein